MLKNAVNRSDIISGVAALVALLSLLVSAKTCSIQEKRFREDTRIDLAIGVKDIRLPLLKLSDGEVATLLARAYELSQVKAKGALSVEQQRIWDSIREKCRGSLDLELMNPTRTPNTVRSIDIIATPVIMRDEEETEIQNARRNLATALGLHSVKFHTVFREGQFPVYLQPMQGTTVRNIAFEVDPLRDIPQLRKGWLLDFEILDVQGARGFYRLGYFFPGKKPGT